MAKPLIGCLNDIFRDSQITGHEMADLENCLFANDGMVDATESYAIFIPDDAVIDPKKISPQDRQRLKILSSNGFTVSRYLEALEKAGLAPANSPQQLKKIADKKMDDRGWQIQSVEKDNASLTISLLHSGGNKTTMILKSDPASLDENIKQLMSQSPEAASRITDILHQRNALEWIDSHSNEISLNEFIHTAVVYLQRHKSDTKTEALIPLVQLLALESNKKDWPALKAINELTNKQNKDLPWDMVLDNHFVDPIPVGGHFYGDTPTSEQNRSLEDGWNYLPASVQSLFEKKGVKVILVNDDTLRILSEDSALQGPIPFVGLADPNSKTIYMPIDLEPQSLVVTYLHEASHMLKFILQEKNPMIDEVLSEHFYNTLGSPISSESIPNTPTPYGASNHEEWFAEFMTMKLLADKPYLTTNDSGYLPGASTIMQHLLLKDQVGFCMMEKLFNSLTNTDSKTPPEQVFTWSNYIKALHIADTSRETPASELYDFILQESGTELEDKWNDILRDYEAGNDVLDKIDSLTKEYPSFAPAMGLLVNLHIETFLNSEQPPIEADALRMFEIFSKVLEMRSFDPRLLTGLEQIIRAIQDGQPGLFAGVENLALKTVSLAQSVFLKDATNTYTKSLYAKSLVLIGAFESGLELLDTALNDYKGALDRVQFAGTATEAEIYDLKNEQQALLGLKLAALAQLNKQADMATLMQENTSEATELFHIAVPFMDDEAFLLVLEIFAATPQINIEEITEIINADSAALIAILRPDLCRLLPQAKTELEF